MTSDNSGSISGNEKPASQNSLSFPIQSDPAASASDIRRQVLDLLDGAPGIAAIHPYPVPMLAPDRLLGRAALVPDLLVMDADGIITAVVAMPEGRSLTCAGGGDAIRPDRIVLVDRLDLAPDAVARLVAALTGSPATQPRGSPPGT